LNAQSRPGLNAPGASGSTKITTHDKPSEGESGEGPTEAQIQAQHAISIVRQRIVENKLEEAAAAARAKAEAAAKEEEERVQTAQRVKDEEEARAEVVLAAAIAKSCAEAAAAEQSTAEGAQQMTQIQSTYISPQEI